MVEIILGLMALVWFSTQVNDNFQVLAENTANDLDDIANKIKENDNEHDNEAYNTAYTNITDEDIPAINHWLNISILCEELLLIVQFINIGVLVYALQDNHNATLYNIAAWANSTAIIYFFIIRSRYKSIQNFKNYYDDIINNNIKIE